MYLIGLTAFLLFFLHDWKDLNDRNNGNNRKGKGFRWGFPLGGLLLIVATVLMCLPFNEGVVEPLGARLLLGAVGLFLVWAEIYSLFFSFSRKEAYASAGVTEGGEPDWKADSQGRALATDRMYALCRHPGVLFFILLYIDLWLCLGMDFPGMVMLCAFNMLLIIYEDKIVFPKVFAGYDEYKQTTPFLVPRCKGIRRCIGDFRKGRP